MSLLLASKLETFDEQLLILVLLFCCVGEINKVAIVRHGDDLLRFFPFEYLLLAHRHPEMVDWRSLLLSRYSMETYRLYPIITAVEFHSDLLYFMQLI